MSAKTNPIILKIGTKLNGFSKFYEKKNNELKNFDFNIVTILNFLKIMFKKFNLNIQINKFFLKRKNLCLFINYSLDSFKFATLLKYKKSKQLKLFKKLYKIKYNKKFLFLNSLELKNIYKFQKTKLIKYLKNYFKYLHFMLKKKQKYKSFFSNFSNFVIYVEKKFKIKYLTMNKKIIKHFNKRFYLIKFFNLLQNNKINHNLFIKKILIVLNNFFKNKYNVVLIFKQLNKHNKITKNQQLKLVSNLINLKKFQNETFFKGTNLLLNLFNNKKTNISYFISEFIASNLPKIKLLNRFLIFLNDNLKFFLLFTNKINGIEIQIKGNLKKNQRAITKQIIVGNKIPKLLINSDSHFTKSVAYLKKGSLGIKIWVFHEK